MSRAFGESTVLYSKFFNCIWAPKALNTRCFSKSLPKRSFFNGAEKITVSNLLYHGVATEMANVSLQEKRVAQLSQVLPKKKKNT